MAQKAQLSNAEKKLLRFDGKKYELFKLLCKYEGVCPSMKLDQFISDYIYENKQTVKRVTSDFRKAGN